MITVSRMLGMSIAFSCYLVTGPILADTSDEIKALKVDIQNLQKAMVQVQKELDEIKYLLKESPRAAAKSSKTAFAPTDTKLGDVHYKGEYDAPVTLIEFSDYQCPYCKRHATAVMPTLITKYVDTGKLNEDYYLGGGLQWTDTDRDHLESVGRPVIEKNFVFPAVNTAIGAIILIKIFQEKALLLHAIQLLTSLPKKK